MASRAYHTRQVTSALIVERKQLEMLDLELHGLTSLQYNKWLRCEVSSSVMCDYISSDVTDYTPKPLIIL